MNRRTGTPGGAAIVWYGLLLFAAAGIQTVFLGRLGFREGHPDLILTLALSAALLSDAGVGCIAGMAGGLVTAAVVGQTVGTYLVSRTLAAFVAGWLTNRLSRGNIGVVVLGVFLTSVLAEVVYGLAAPRLTLRHWVEATLIGAAMNAALALPVSLLLRRCGWGRGYS
jgi:rod shape-determining protein MreD